MDQRLCLRLPNRLDQIADCCARASHWLGERGATPRTIYRAELMLEELISNVIRHGFEDEREHEIQVEIEPASAGLLLRLRDDGRLFDPTSAPEPTHPHSLEDTAIGGRGLMLVRRMSDGLRYSREGGWNRTEVLLREG